MNDQGLSKLWLIVGAGVTYLSINFWSYSQQWRVELPSIVKFNADIAGGHHITNAAALLGMIVVGLPLLLLLCLTIAYARRHAGLPAAFRIPRIGKLGIDPGTRTGRRIQFATAIALLGIPVAAQVHFFRKFLDGTASNGTTEITGWSHLRYDGATAFDGSFTYDTVTYFPFAEGWLFVILEIAIAVLAVWAAYAIVRVEPKR